jgi:hypothetical protein
VPPSTSPSSSSPPLSTRYVSSLFTNTSSTFTTEEDKEKQYASLPLHSGRILPGDLIAFKRMHFLRFFCLFYINMISSLYCTSYKKFSVLYV